MSIRFYLFTLFVLAQAYLFGQVPGSRAIDSLSNTAVTDTTQEEIPEIIDTIPVSFYYQQSRTQVIPFSDTSLSNGFHHYDFGRRNDYEDLHLGTAGSAARPLMFDGVKPFGLNMGIQAFDRYFIPADSLAFYDIIRPFTDTYFSFTGKQNAIFFGRFARQFDDGIQFSLAYNDVNQTGLYLEQAVKLNALTTGLEYAHPSGKYVGYLTFASNVAQQQDNGGLATDTLFFSDGLSSPESQPIRISTAQTRYSDKKIQYRHYLNLGNPKSGNYLDIGHQFWYQKQWYRFYDNAESLDSTFYGLFVQDDRGVRQNIWVSSFGNSFDLGFKGHRPSGETFDWLPRVGIQLIQYRIAQEPDESERTHINLTGKWAFKVRDFMHFKTNARISLLGNTGDYALSGKLMLDAKKIGRWSFSADLQAITPSLLAQKNYITQVPLWNNDFKKEFVNRLGGTYSLPKFDLEVGGNLTVLNNWIYYDQAGFAQQEAKTIPLIQVFFRKDIHLRKFHLENTLLYQKTDNENLRRPEFYIHQQTYWEGDVFKNALLLRVGAELRFMSSWQPQAYQPAIGQFILQDSLTAPNFPGVDAFLDFKVKSFRAFFKVENMTYWWDKRIFYHTAGHPVFKPTIRIGIGWQFRN